MYTKRAPRTALLSLTDSERTIRFVSLLLKATDVLVTQADAEIWMRSPALGLHQRIPKDLITTDAVAKIVRDHLTRVDHRVYIRGAPWHLGGRDRGPTVKSATTSTYGPIAVGLTVFFPSLQDPNERNDATAV